MTIQKFVVENYTMYVELLGLLILLAVGVHIPRRMREQTWIATLLLFVETLVFALEKWMQQFATLHPLRSILTALLYSLYPLILIFVVRIIAVKPFTRRQWIFFLLPEAVSILLFFTSPWTHLVFWFWEDNHYANGPLYLLPYFLFLYYAGWAVVMNVSFFSNYTRRLRISTLYMIVAPLSGALVYWLLGTDRDYSELFTSALLLFFVFIYIHLSKSDPLTGLWNRQSYYQQMRNDKNISGVASLDMNDLKYLNDHFGHDAGDAALKTVAEVIRSNCGPKGTPYRVGGDEFMILYTDGTEEEIKTSIAAIEEALSHTSYVCAAGYAMCSADKTIEETIVISDERMYKDKAKKKRR